MAKRRGCPKVFDQGPQFFEIYLPEYSSRQLCIPPAFIKHFNGQIPDKFILKDRGGKSWNVDMQKANNGLFIRNGWRAFISGNSVKAGDFLVFRYNGSSSFTVKIFGKNGCKKEEAPAFEKTDVHVKIEPDSDGEVEQTARQRSCTGKYSKVALKNPQKLRGTVEISQVISPRRALGIGGKEKAFGASEFPSVRNPCFTAKISASRLYTLNIPKPVLEKHHIKLDSKVVLRNIDGSNWPVKVSPQKDGRILLTRGWKDFLKKNGLGLDDKCMFKFVCDRGRLCKVFKVYIQRARQITQNQRGLWTKWQP